MPLCKHIFYEEHDGVCALCDYKCEHKHKTDGQCKQCKMRDICSDCNNIAQLYHCCIGLFCSSCYDIHVAKSCIIERDWVSDIFNNENPKIEY